MTTINTGWVPGDSDHDKAEPAHTKDSACTLDENFECTVCGVYHGDPCCECGGRGFHDPDCIVLKPIPPTEREIEEARGEYLYDLWKDERMGL